MSDVTVRYTDGTYAANNPTWHAEDAPWKADQIMRVFDPAEKVLRICEVGCGVGGVLAELGTRLSARGVEASLHGFDVAPGAIAKARELWACRPEMTFHDQDVLAATTLSYDVYLFIDVLEHLDQPVAFLKALCARGMRRCIVHLPLENNWVNIVRGRTDPRRSKVGHLHFFDTHSAIGMLEIAGLSIDRWVYTPELDLDVKLHRTAGSVAAYVPRKALLALAPALAVHTIGGAAFMANCSFAADSRS
ncbi:MAG: methyltransferase domain-containing protein [Acidobacteria bacterium]|nr:methyltransferase domain-containing protein [Acidobacteriota bacterium]